MRLFYLLVFILLFLSSCNLASNNNSQTNSREEQEEISQNIFSDSMTEFTVNVIYETGAEPYTGNIGITANDTWDITRRSYEELFSTHTGRTITVPNSLTDMTEIPDQGKSTWSSEELLSLGESLSTALISNNKVTVNIILLEGKYNGSNSILGVHFPGSHFAFVFKDIVESVGGDGVTQRYVEQGTIVHEIGHLIGLVNNGVPMSTNHEDSTHPRHTSNDEGVMYWAVESSDNILTSISDIIVGNQLQLFGTQSLADGQAYHP